MYYGVYGKYSILFSKTKKKWLKFSLLLNSWMLPVNRANRTIIIQYHSIRNVNSTSTLIVSSVFSFLVCVCPLSIYFQGKKGGGRINLSKQYIQQKKSFFDSFALAHMSSLSLSLLVHNSSREWDKKAEILKRGKKRLNERR